jgi:hypothetical protein
VFPTATTILSRLVCLICRMKVITPSALEVRVDERKLILIPFDTTPSETRLNFEGIVAYNPHSPDIGYIQLFRNGSIEAVDAHVLGR